METKIEHKIGDPITAPNGKQVGTVSKVLKRSLMFECGDKIHCFNSHGVLLSGTKRSDGKVQWQPGLNLEEELGLGSVDAYDWAVSHAISASWNSKGELVRAYK